MIGRSHGVHAEPMTFGLKFALWYEDMRRNMTRMKKAREVISIGKLSGAVGTFSNIPPAIEEKVCKKLGLETRNSCDTDRPERQTCRISDDSCADCSFCRKDSC